MADPAFLERMGGALALLGIERALLVHGRDGMDEVSTGAVSDTVAVIDGAVTRGTIDPDELGFPPPPNGVISGGDPAHNARRAARASWGARRGTSATWWC